MEKIIAVVVMIAIVVGLIATAVLPMVGQMNEQGSQAQNQLSQMTQTMDGNQMTGAQVKSELAQYYARIGTGADQIQAIKVVGFDASGANKTIDITNTGVTSAQSEDVQKYVADGTFFSKKVANHASGKLRKIEYIAYKSDGTLAAAHASDVN